MGERPKHSRKIPTIPHAGRACATFVALALVLAACTASTTSPRSTASGPVGRSTAPEVGAAGRSPALPSDGTSGTAGTLGTATAVSDPGVLSAGSGVAYPNLAYPVAGAIAPEGTILASGTGTAQVHADRSDLAAAREKASAAALADARAQADAAAAAAGVRILGLYSMAISVADDYPGPIADGCPILPPLRAGGGSSDGGTTAPGATAAPAAPALPAVCSSFAPSASQLVATVTVAYMFG